MSSNLPKRSPSGNWQSNREQTVCPAGLTSRHLIRHALRNPNPPNDNGRAASSHIEGVGWGQSEESGTNSAFATEQTPKCCCASDNIGQRHTHAVGLTACATLTHPRPDSFSVLDKGFPAVDLGANMPPYCILQHKINVVRMNEVAFRQLQQSLHCIQSPLLPQ